MRIEIPPVGSVVGVTYSEVSPFSRPVITSNALICGIWAGADASIASDRDKSTMTSSADISHRLSLSLILLFMTAASAPVMTAQTQPAPEIRILVLAYPRLAYQSIAPRK